MTTRAVFFVDGNNWYHCAKSNGIDPKSIDLLKVASKLAMNRTLVGLRYYTGKVQQTGNLRLHADQQRFLDSLVNQDKRISVFLGRIEPRREKNKAAAELLEYMAKLRTPIDRTVYKELVAMGARHKVTEYMVEKGVDVMLAVDLVLMAERDEYDTAYLVSADGDYTHACEGVRKLGKKVFAVSPSHGAQLAGAVDSFLHLSPDWFADCAK